MPISEGPIFICVVCSRCLYKANVKKGNGKDYSDLFLSVNTGLISCDKEYYICLTCQKSLKKNNIRCQSVANNLFQSEISKEISALTILEKRANLSAVVIEKNCNFA